MLWMTTMNVDDPDHRDLNEIYRKMLAVGAPPGRYTDHFLLLSSFVGLMC